MTDVRQISVPFRRSRDQDRRQPAPYPVVTIGAGPRCLVAALDPARKGHRSIVIDTKGNLADGSRAICWAKRSLEIMDRARRRHQRHVGLGFAASPGRRPHLPMRTFPLAQRRVPVKTLLVSDPIACGRYGAERQGGYDLFRPDQHVVARWRSFDRAAVEAAVARASGRN